MMMMMMIPHVQLATPSGSQVNHIPKGDLVRIYKYTLVSRSAFLMASWAFLSFSLRNVSKRIASSSNICSHQQDTGVGLYHRPLVF